MTNSEYILRTLQDFGITQDTVDVILFEASLTGDAPCDITACKRAMLAKKASIRICVKRNVSEGGMSISWAADADDALTQLFNEWADELGEDKVGLNVIKDISDKW